MAKKSFFKKHSEALKRATLQGLMIVVVSVVTLEATSLLQYYFSSRSITEEANRRAEGHLKATELQILSVTDQVETAVRNTLWSVQHQTGKPDSLAAITSRMVSQNNVIYGSAVALIDKNIAPYSFRNGEEVSLSTLATQEYDYRSQEWFCKPLELGGGYWSEPYYDEGGGGVIMTTYSVPVMVKGKPVAVFTADVSLDWLTELVGKVKVYPNTYNFMISRSGRIMVSPAETLVMRHSIQEVAQKSDGSEVFAGVGEAMLSGRAGDTQLKYKGKMLRVFFDTISRTGWSMSIIIPEDEIYGESKRVGFVVLLLQILGVALLIVILYSTVKNQRALKLASDSKTRIEGELQAASDIQSSMLPKTFPPFPSRDDIDMAAAIVPAKEVGGDLYDFYIRDEKLFFCIGDVSGKGVPASLFMAVTRSLFRSVSNHEHSPAKIVTTMNDSLSESNDASMFVTFFCGVLDMKTGHMVYCNAGHNAPIALTDCIGELPVDSNIPLGIMPGFAFTEQEADIRYDDAIFLYTDGVTEAENIHHELFGEERMIKVLHTRRSASEQMACVADAVREFRGEAAQSDDITVLFIHYLGKEETGDKVLKITFDNDISQIPRLEGFIDEIREATGIDAGLAMSLNLALEEAVTNVMMYAYPEGASGSVNLKAILKEGSVEFVLWDKGVPFDPTAAPEADTTLGVEERAIGGLGIHLVRNIMDIISYENKNGMNILTMIKNTK
jgi:sigma-B regulation protein RsbU (phosphoserine phosphatase)